jgi:protein associated with RNAse G/E
VINQTWQILALKYDQKPHYTWPATFVDDDGDQLRFESVVGGMLVHYTRGFQEPTRRRSMLTFWRDRWYNVFTNYMLDGQLSNFYCNVAMPCFIKEYTLGFVDLDLDVRVYPDGNYQVLDEDEFELHRVKYSYPAWVQDKARQTVDEIVALSKLGEGPFQILNT